MTDSKLLPCPLCGDEAEFTPNNEPWHAINCKSSCIHTGNHNQEYKAASRWNTRANSHDKLKNILAVALDNLKYVNNLDEISGYGNRNSTIAKIEAVLEESTHG